MSHDFIDVEVTLRRNDDGTFGLDLNRFARVRCEPSPEAASAGIKVFDRITHVNNGLVQQTTSMAAAVEGLEKVVLIVERPPKALLRRIAEHENAANNTRPYRRHARGAGRSIKVYDPEAEAAADRRRQLSREFSSAASRLWPTREYFRVLSATLFPPRQTRASTVTSKRPVSSKGSVSAKGSAREATRNGEDSPQGMAIIPSGKAFHTEAL